MILGIAALLTCLFSVPLVAARHRRTRLPGDMLSPDRVASVFHLVTIVPYLVLVSVDESVVNPLVRFSPYVGDLDKAVAWYAVVQGLGFVALMLGIRFRPASRLAARLPVIATGFRPARCRAAIITALVVAGLGFALFLSQVGGFQTLMLNLEKRTTLTAGAGYVLALLNLLFFAIVILVYSMRVDRTPFKWLALAVLILCSAAVFSSLGGRKSTLLIFISVLFAWHYGVRPIRRIRMLHVVLALSLLPYFVLMPILRERGGVAYYSANPGELPGEIGKNMRAAITDLSYVDTFVFVTSYFRSDNVWHGATYLDLLKAPVPSSIDPAKPPIDDGVYVRTLAEGVRAEPGMPFSALVYSSWPPETLGTAFMNFWLPGVIVEMFLLGALYRLTYIYMLRSGRTLYSILVYAHVVVSFHLSNLRIVQASVYLTMTTLFFGVFFGFRRRRERIEPARQRRRHQSLDRVPETAWIANRAVG